jgi:hypothetical protein
MRRGKKVKSLTNSGNNSRLIVHLTKCDAQNTSRRYGFTLNFLTVYVTILLTNYALPICFKKLTCDTNACLIFEYSI